MALIDNLLGQLCKAVAPVAKEAVNVAGQHFAKHGSKYLKAAVGTCLVAGGYLGGKAIEYNKGKKAGIAEQAKRDEEKFRLQNQEHEKDREHWKNQIKGYEDTLNEIERNQYGT
ncbi:MAG: hypothetical protein HDS26_04555 [Bacteroides sp.]|nr:hypothetical protein [Bacteroides sp.]